MQKKAESVKLMNQVFYVSSIYIRTYEIVIMKSNCIYDTIGLVNANLNIF